jgi:DUF1680 family protein
VQSTKLLIVSPANVTLHLRVPSWISHPVTVKVNGKALDASASPGSYFSIRRDWQTGDVVEMNLPMSLRYEAMPDDENLRALLYGPLVLAGGLGDHGITHEMVIGPEGPEMDKSPAPRIPEFVVGNKRPDEWLRASGPVSFDSVGQANAVKFVPLYRMNGQRYSIYWRMSQTSEI